MRTIFITLLLATVAAAPPVSTQSQDRNSNRPSAQHHSGARHSGSPPNSTNPQRTGPIHGGPHVNPPPSSGSATVRIARPPNARQVESHKGPINVTPNERRRTHSVDQHAPAMHGQPQHSHHALPQRPVISTVPRPGTEPPQRNFNRSNHRSHWSPAWRNDNRYDWRHWRQQHRSRYHFHPYVDPFGWGYYRYTIGWRLWPHYYASSYWIADPAYYRLPPAPAGTHWVRYYNDALLVDTWTGEVVDVIYGFFW